MSIYNPTAPPPECASVTTTEISGWFRSQPLTPISTPIDLRSSCPTPIPTNRYRVLNILRFHFVSIYNHIRDWLYLRHTVSTLSGEVELLRRDMKWTKDLLLHESVRMARQVVRLIKLEDRVTRLDNGGSDVIPDTDSKAIPKRLSLFTFQKIRHYSKLQPPDHSKFILQSHQTCLIHRYLVRPHRPQLIRPL
jgi:hypothetical protein